METAWSQAVAVPTRADTAIVFGVWDGATPADEQGEVSFNLGLKDNFDVIRAEQDLVQAKYGFIQRRLSYTVLLAQLEKWAGKPTGRILLDGRQAGGTVGGAVPENLGAGEGPRRAPAPKE
jgi:hypothetical protein